VSGVASEAPAVEALSPVHVERPPTPTAVAAELAAARARGLKVLPRGHGTRRGPAATPGPVDRIVSTERLTKVVEYEPGDQTITVQAGLPLAELDALLARHGQWLPVQQGAGTIGGLLASGADGALDLGYGRLRDRLLGCTLALANGALVGGRGRVVKNVAGYDLPRLLLGSLGTLGIVVEASLRVQPRPEAHTSMVYRFGAPEPAFAAADALLESGLEPVFCDVLLSANVPVAGPEVAARLAFGFDGLRSVVPQLIGAADELVSPHQPGTLELGAGEHDEPLRDSLHDPKGAAVLRVQAPRTALPALTRELASAAHATGVKVRADARPGLGLLLLAIDPAPEAVVRALLATARAAGPTVLLEGPAAVGAPDDVWGAPPPDFPLMQAIKRALDAESVLAAGRYVGGL
jgi:glycolate oxidase FAD binding subunit